MANWAWLGTTWRWTWRLGLGALGLGLVGTVVWASIYREAAWYLFQSARGQSQLLFGGLSVEAALGDEMVSEKFKIQLRLVQEVKKYSEKKLFLQPTHNYEKFIDLKRDYLVMVLTASPPLRLESYTWWFPIVGTVPYKGYFDKAEAEKAQAKLQAEGYETYLRGAPAYSTLGWFNDPLLSTMLLYGEFYLASTVIHESVHATLWIPGDVTFNENLASFVGTQGALQFYAQKYGPKSSEYLDAQNKLADQKIFAEFINELAERLEKLYKSNLFDANKQEEKKEIIAEMKVRYREEILPKFKGTGYEGFEEREWNNALIMSYRHYNRDQEKFAALFKEAKEDIPTLMNLLRAKGPALLKSFRESAPSPGPKG